MSTNEETLVRLLKESLEEFMLTAIPESISGGIVARTVAFKFRLPIEYSNYPMLKAAADHGLIDVAATVNGSPETQLVEIKLSGHAEARELRLGPAESASNSLPADVWKSFAGKVSTAFGQPPDDIINDFLGLRKDGTPAPSEDAQKFLIDDQAFSVAEEHKDVELPNSPLPKEDIHKLLDSAAERYVKESFEPYPTGMLLTVGAGLYPDTGHPTTLIKKLYGLGLIDLLGPKGNGDILMCLDTDKVDVKVKTSALSWELDFYQRLEDVLGHDPNWLPIAHEWAQDSIKRGILFGERFAESTDQTPETFEITNHDETVDVDVNALDINYEYPLPTWASHRSSDLQLGSQLCTRDGRRCGNAVVAAVWINSHGARIYDVITDVGNVLHAEACEVNEMFHPPEYVMKDEWVAEITERVKSDG